MTSSERKALIDRIEFTEDCRSATGFIVNWCDECKCAHVYVHSNTQQDPTIEVFAVLNIWPEWIDGIINDLQNIKALAETGARKQ